MIGVSPIAPRPSCSYSLRSTSPRRDSPHGPARPRRPSRDDPDRKRRASFPLASGFGFRFLHALQRLPSFLGVEIIFRRPIQRRFAFGEQFRTVADQHHMRRIRSMTARARLIGFFTCLTPPTDPAFNVFPSMMAASISCVPALVKTAPLPALKSGSSSITPHRGDHRIQARTAISAKSRCPASRARCKPARISRSISGRHFAPARSCPRRRESPIRSFHLSVCMFVLIRF